MVVTLESLGLQGRFASARFATGADSIVLSRLAPDVSFEIVLTDASGRDKTIRVRAAPPDLPRYTVSVTGAVAEGNIHAGVFSGLGLANPSFNMIFTVDGTPTYFRRIDHPTINFQRIVYADGTIRYAYHDVRFAQVPGKGSANGDVVLLDEGFREIRRLRLLPFGKHGEIAAENHDFIIFNDDHWVLCAYDVRTVDLSAHGGKADSGVSATILQEIDRGVVVWEWDSTDYPDFYAASVQGNDYMNSRVPVADYMHFNSIEYDPTDRSYLLSFRHLDSIVKIAPFEPRSGGPIPIKWILGGKLDQFGLTPLQRFYHQHDARVISRSGSVLQLSVFNNNNDHFQEHPSSAMVLSINEATRSAALVDEYHDAMFSSAQGSMQVLAPRHYFIGWGNDNRISESVAGNRVFLMDFEGALLVYRARKVK